MVQFDNVNGELLQKAWDKLIPQLEKEVEIVKAKGNALIPVVDFNEAVKEKNGQYVFDDDVVEKVRKIGSVVVRNVIPKDEARQLKLDLDTYLKNNPEVVVVRHVLPKDEAHQFKPDLDTSLKNNPEVRGANNSMYHLFWTPSQLRARSHPNMIKLQQALMNIWYCRDSDSQEVSTKFPLALADRFRIREPGGKMRLYGHMDGGFIGTGDNRAELNQIFAKILNEGNFEEYDPFDYTDRISALDNEHASERGKGGTMFRMFQGWLSMSSTGPGGGTLQVCPMLKYTSAYALLRPYFASSIDFNSDPSEDNSEVPWIFTGRDVFGGRPSCHEMNKTHPHLQLDETMVSVPFVEPGDYVAWHCDTIHAVEYENSGPGDSSVMYIPAVPLTKDNALYLVKQRDAFKNLTQPPMFMEYSEEKAEKTHVGAGSLQDIIGTAGLQAMGLGRVPFDALLATSQGERQVIEKVNKLLFA